MSKDIRKYRLNLECLESRRLLSVNKLDHAGLSDSEVLAAVTMAAGAYTNSQADIDKFIATPGAGMDGWSVITKNLVDYGLSPDRLVGAGHYYQSLSYTLSLGLVSNVFPGDAEAIVFRNDSTGDVGLAFRGTDSASDVTDWLERGRLAHYGAYANLFNALDAYVIDQGVQRVLVAGHSLGAAMAELYMAEHADGQLAANIEYEAVTVASPTARLPSIATDTRVLNIGHFYDLVYSIELPPHSISAHDVQNLRAFFPGPCGCIADIASTIVSNHSSINYIHTIRNLLQSEFYDSTTRTSSVVQSYTNAPSFWYDTNLWLPGPPSPLNGPTLVMGLDETLTLANGIEVSEHNLLMGGTGDDIIVGLGGDDRIIGDTLGTVGNGADTLSGGSGRDTFAGTVAAFNGDVILDLEIGDRIEVWSNRLRQRDVVQSNDSIQILGSTIHLGGGGMPANAVVSFAGVIDGNSIFEIVEESDFILTGTDQADQVEVTKEGGYLIATLNDELWQTALVTRVPLIQFEGLRGDDSFTNRTNIRSIAYGGPGNDRLRGGSGDDDLYGGNNNDRLFGGRGDDNLFGEAGKDRLFGGSGEDSLYGGDNKDRLKGGGGTDHLFGENGNDILKGGRKKDYLFGGSGNDKIYGEGGNDEAHGGNGNDVIEGGAGNDDIYGGEENPNYFDSSAPDNDKLFGGSGRDLIAGGPGRDHIEGGDGNDELYGDEGRDFIYGNNGADDIFGGAGEDDIFGGADPDVIEGNGDGDLIYGDGGNDTLRGNDGIDEIYGGSGDDEIEGNGNSDFLYGEGDWDKIWGGDGKDSIFGGSGNDRLFGGNDRDEIYGGANNDLIKGDSGNDKLFGDAGDDEIYGDADNDDLFGGWGNDELFGGWGIDELFGEGDNDRLEGNGDTDFLFASSGNDFLWGDTGDDYYIFDGNVRGNVEIVDQGGTNTLDFRSLNQGVEIDLGDRDRQQIGDNLAIDLNRLDAIDVVLGSRFDDSIVTTSRMDQVVEGNGGDDRLRSRGGDDFLRGGRGADYYAALQDNSGTLTVEDNDPSVLSFATLTSGIVLDLYDRGPNVISESGLTLNLGSTAIHTVIGTEFSDLIWGDDNANTLWGMSGADLLVGRGGNDEILGWGNHDILSGGPGQNRLFGEWNPESGEFINGAGDDLLIGGDQYDELYGGYGGDVLFGRGHSDFLSGGPGGDWLSGGDMPVYDFQGDGLFYLPEMLESYERFERLAQTPLLTLAGQRTGLNYIETAVVFLPFYLNRLSYFAIDDSYGDDIYGGPENDPARTYDYFVICPDDYYSPEDDDNFRNCLDPGEIEEIRASNDRPREPLQLIAAAQAADIPLTENEILDRLADTSTVVRDLEFAATFEHSDKNANDVDIATLLSRAGSAFVDASLLTVVGTNSNDRIVLTTIGSNLIAEINGIPNQFALADVSTIEVLALDGNDFFQNDTALNVTAKGGDGDDHLVGGSGVDDLFGGNGNDVLAGGRGDDALIGGPGDDTLTGGYGDDTLLGRKGNDKLRAGQGDDSASGGEGNDRVWGGLGDDFLIGGAGDDYLNSVDGTYENDVIDDEQGVNRVIRDGAPSRDSPINRAPLTIQPADGARGVRRKTSFAWESINSVDEYVLRIYSGDKEVRTIYVPKSGEQVTGYTIPEESQLRRLTEYTWTVEARNSGPNGPASEAQSFTTRNTSPAFAPSNLTPLDGSTGARRMKRFSWSNLKAATQYVLRVYEGDTLVRERVVDEMTGGTTEYTFTESEQLNRLTEYTFTVSGMNSAGEGPASQHQTFTTRNTAPTFAPSGLSPADGSTGTRRMQNFSWSNLRAATEYVLKIHDGERVVRAVVVEETAGGETSYTLSEDDQLKRLTTYSFTVAGRNSAGDGPASAPQTFTTRNTSPALSPANVTPGNGATGVRRKTRFSWSNLSAADQYVLRIYNSSGVLVHESDDIANVPGGRTTYTLSEADQLRRLTTYTFTVSGKNSAGEGPASTPNTITTRNTAPDNAPGDVTPINGATGVRRMTNFGWSNLSNADSYVLRIYNSSGVLVHESDDIANVPGGRTTYTLSEADQLRRLTTYTFTVSGKNSAGEGPASTPNTITTRNTAPDNAPGDVTPINGATGVRRMTNFGWSNLSNADSYVLRIYNSSGVLVHESDDIANVPGGRTTYTLSEADQLRRLTTYTFTVSGKNSAGEGPASTPNTITTRNTAPDNAPGDVTPINGATGVRRMTNFGWSNLSNADSYVLRIYNSSGVLVHESDDIANVPGGRTTYTLSEADQLRRLTTYTFTVTGKNSAGEGPASDAHTITTRNTAPDNAPGDVTPINGATGVRRMTNFGWSNLSNADSYVLRIFNSNGVLVREFDVAEVTGGRTTYTLSEADQLRRLTTYTFTVAGKNSAGEGPVSTPNTIRTRNTALRAPRAALSVPTSAPLQGLKNTDRLRDVIARRGR